jgi:hypothetical protein
MAGGFGSKQSSKNHQFSKNSFNNSEVLKSSDSFYQSEKPAKIQFGGVLKLGQPAELSKSPKIESNWKKEFLNVSYLQKEQENILNHQQSELKKTIEDLKGEIKKLIVASEGLENEVEQAAAQPIAENNQYQLNFLQRIRQLIINFTRNISQAKVWLESFSRKKQKRNAFWNNVKNKKGGGEQYLFSNEHSVARSAN